MNPRIVKAFPLMFGLILVLASGAEAHARPQSHSSGTVIVNNTTYVQTLPRGFRKIRSRDADYYHHHGKFYRHTPSGYVIVAPPLGVVISELPWGYRPIARNEVTYYYYNNTYYLKEPAGYTVVNPPAEVVTANPVAIEAPEKTVVVNVPNPNGSYIPVVLQQYSSGYKGPQGEFYPAYPSIEQLKAMYAKESRAAEAPEPQEIIYEVPNKNGSVTRVKVVRSADGYVGPEGEYYAEKPTMEQLVMMYAKE